MVGPTNDTEKFGHTISAGPNGADMNQKLYGEFYAVSCYCPFLDDWNDGLKNYRRNLEENIPTRQSPERIHAISKSGRLDRAI